MADQDHPTTSNRKYVAISKLVSPDELRRLYEDELRTDAEIARMFGGASDVSISQYRKRHGIQTITARQRKEIRKGKPALSLDDLSPAKLRDLYSRMGDREIGKLCKVSKPTIRKLRQMWGIEAISKSERATSKDELTDEQKEVLIGITLGDGHILPRGSFKVSHAYHQISYLKECHRILRSISKPIYYVEQTMAESGELCPAFGFRTVQHVWFKAMRKLFYPDGEKVFPASVLDGLTPKSLAFWYFDDGNLSDGLPSFALGNISTEAAEDVCDRMAYRFGFSAYMSPRSAPNCKIMALRAKSCDLFFHLVREHATTDMLYKIPERYWPKDAKPVPKTRTTEQMMIPKNLRQRCGQWADLVGAEREEILDHLVAFWRKVGFPHHIQRIEHLTVISNLDESQIVQGGAIKARQVGQSSCQAFMPHIWEAHTYGDHRSPMVLFEDDEKLREVLTQILDAGNIPNATKLRGRLRYYRLTGVYNFRPSAAKALVDRYCSPSGVVWDPCAGWGGRLMGATLSANKVRYLGCEPSSATVRGLHELKTWMDEYVPGLARRVEIHAVPAEDFNPPSGLDLVLTSPPYWKREHYSDEDTQSTARYPSYHVWIDNFWRPVLSKAVRALKVGGWLVLNVDDFTVGGVRYNFIEDTVRIVEALGLKETERFNYEVPSPVKDSNTEVVVAFCKAPEAVLHPTASVSVEVVEPEKLLSPKKVHIHVCPVCQKKYEALRKDTVYCTDTCSARARRLRRKNTRNLKGHRDVNCKDCGSGFRIPVTGGVPNRCPKCAALFKEKDDLDRRTKHCTYRECGQEFVDYSSNNSSKFCCEEHRRREKLFRLGKIGGVEQFRQEDPVIPGRKVSYWTCRLCGEKFKKKGGDRRNRCPTCLGKKRNKVCRRCNSPYQDDSLNNTRRYCDICRDSSRFAKTGT